MGTLPTSCISAPTECAPSPRAQRTCRHLLHPGPGDCRGHPPRRDLGSSRLHGRPHPDQRRPRPARPRQPLVRCARRACPAGTGRLTMPELPEIQAHVERIDRDFAGATLERFSPLTFTALKTVEPAPDVAYGHQLVSVRRRGKYLLARLRRRHLRRAPDAGWAAEARRQAVGQASRRPAPAGASTTVGRCCSPKQEPSARPACGSSGAIPRRRSRLPGSGPTPTRWTERP